MKKTSKETAKILLITSIIGTILCFATLSQAGDNKNSFIDDLTEALKSGTPTLELRLGYEHSDMSDSGKDAANAINLRSRVGYRTGEFMFSQVYLQFHNLTNLMDEFTPEDHHYDVIADPHGSRVHQGYLDFKGIPETTLRIGRQEIVLDDARLIGNVDWRQNGQSFDAVSLTNKSLKDFKLYGAYVNQVNSILLDYIDLDNFFLINAKYSGIEGLNITAFCYLLDTESNADSARDCATYGLRLDGKLAAFDYDVTGAYQSDFADGKDHDSYMITAAAGYKIGKVRIGGGYQYISGQDDSDRPFDTLYSTAHKFNGWADVFLSTNGGKLKNGLQDYYVDLGATLFWGVKMKAVYHYFDTAEKYNNFNDDYGNEIDLLMVKKINKNLKLLLKYAHYSEKNHSASYTNVAGGHDEDVYWARIMFKF